jgi:hypothetical protein
VTGVKVRPVLVFVLTLVVVAPVIAIAGVVAWGNWTPTGLMVAGALVVWTGRRALESARAAPTIAGIRLRMVAVLWMVIVAAGLLTAGSAFWLGWRLMS